jgi:O-antigen ligase
LLCVLGGYASMQWYDLQRVALSVCLLLVSSVVMFLLRHGDSGDWRINACLLAATMLGAVSSAVSTRPEAAAAEWAVVGLLFLIVATGGGHNGPRQAAVLAAIAYWCVAGTYVAGVAIKYLVTVMHGGNPGADTFLLYLSNPRFPAQIEALTLPLAPLAIHLATKRSVKWLAAVIGALWWMCLFGSASRTAWIALAVAFAVVVSMRTAGVVWLKLQAMLVSGGAAAFLIFFYLLPGWLGLRHELETGRFEAFGSVTARFDMFEASLRMAANSPVFGVGPMHFAVVDNRIAAHPHNFWLQHLAEWGTLSTLFVVIAVAILVVRLRTSVLSGGGSSTDALGRLAAVSVLAAIVSWAVGCLADGYMVIPTSQALSAVVLALGVALLPPVCAAREIQIGLAWGWRIVTLLAVVVLAYVASTPFGNPVARHQQWAAQHPDATLLAPRFWQQGWIGPDADPTAR